MLWPRLQTLSAMCPPSLLSTMCPLKPWPCLWTLSALGLPWGQGRGIIKQNSFAAVRNPQRLYCMPAGQFPSVILAHQNCLGSMLVSFLFSPQEDQRENRKTGAVSFQNPGWAPIFFATWALLSMDMQTRHKGHVWTDCPELPDLGRVRKSDELQAEDTDE